MKMLRKDVIILPVIIGLFSLFSCQNDDRDFYLGNNNYVVTIVPENGTFYLVTDDGETLEPTKDFSFTATEKQRATAFLTFSEKKSSLYDHVVRVYRLDPFLTKPIAENLGDKNLEIYGNDPVTIDICWIGDGYLNILFGTYWGDKTHFINLIQTDEENNPYELEFRHNAYGDSKTKFDSNIVAFDLSSLPDTEGKTVELKLKVRELNNTDKTYILKYNSVIQKENSSMNDVIPEIIFKENRIYNIAY